MLKVEIKEHKEGVCVIVPRGRLDSDTYYLLEEKVKTEIEKGPEAIVLDLYELEYISSAGLGVIFHTKKVMEDKKKTVALINVQSQIKKVLEIVHVLKGSPIFKNMEEVDTYLDSIQKIELEKRDHPV